MRQLNNLDALFEQCEFFYWCSWATDVILPYFQSFSLLRLWLITTIYLKLRQSENWRDIQILFTKFKELAISYNINIITVCLSRKWYVIQCGFLV
jgi:hypothetical protein